MVSRDLESTVAAYIRFLAGRRGCIQSAGSEIGGHLKEKPETKMLSTTARTETKAVPTFQRHGVGVASIRPPMGGSMNRRSRDVVNENRSYHISNEAGCGGIVQTVGAIGAFARDHGPGCYAVDVHFPDLFDDSVDSSKAWGKVIHHLDGKVAIHIHPISNPM
jgi:hypothetical protein